MVGDRKLQGYTSLPLYCNWHFYLMWYAFAELRNVLGRGGKGKEEKVNCKNKNIEQKKREIKETYRKDTGNDKRRIMRGVLERFN